MKETEIRFPSHDTEYEIRALLWEPDGQKAVELSEPKGIIQILHGMAEHIERYRDFAEYCTEQGFIVCGHDHVGHGKSLKAAGAHGDIPSNGMDIMIEDAHQLRQRVRERYLAFPHHEQHEGQAGSTSSSLDDSLLPFVMFGHSMGSFVLRTYLAQYGDGVAAAVVCGTGHQSALLSAAGRLIAHLSHAFKGPDHRSTLIHNLSIGGYAKQIEGARTPLDWLSTDEAVVEQYDADPQCGFMFGAGGNIALTTLTGTMVKKSTVESVPNDLPLLFIAGEDDPVGEKGAGVKRAVELFEKTGHTKVTLVLYEGMRHEILNERGNEQVYADIVDWIAKQV